MALSGWVATHTGMPSVTPSAAGPVYAGDRLLTVVDTAHVGVPVSDPLAPVGEPVTYTQGPSRVTLTRTAPVGSIRDLGWVTTESGRTVPGLGWYNDGGPRSYSTGVSTSAAHGGRWPLVRPLMTGSVQLVLAEPRRLDEAVDLLRREASVILLAPPGRLGLPSVQRVVIKSLSVRRVGYAGETTVSADWVEYRWVPTPGQAAEGGLAAPVVVWGEWDALDHAWRSRTYLDLCRLVAGMPA